MLKRFYPVMLGLTAVLAVAAAVYFILAAVVPPSVKPGLATYRAGDVFPVRAGAPVQEEREYLCGDVQVVFLGRAPADMVGLDRAALERRYPASRGWSVETQGSLLVLKQRVNDFCPEHRNYRHLGTARGALAVYEGPLGCNQKLLRVEDKMPLSALPPDFQVKLEQAMDFNRQDVETQAVLRSELEFADEQALNAMLDNLDETSTVGQPVS